jgi:hypothetical protein
LIVGAALAAAGGLAAWRLLGARGERAATTELATESAAA